MSVPDVPRRSALATLRALLVIAAPPRGRFLLSIALGAGAAMSTVALMACSGALIDKAALRPPLYTLTVLMAGVQVLALGRGPLRYGERIFSHDSALRAIGRLRLWLYDEVEPRTPAAFGHWRSGDLLSRAMADVDSLQDLALRGISPVLVGVSSSVFAVGLVAIILSAAGLVLAGCLGGALCLTSVVAWWHQRGLGAREAALRGELSADVVELLRGAADLVAFGRDEELLERALADDEALARLARRRSWTAGAVSGLATAFNGIAVIGLLAVAIPAAGAHRLPGYMLAVLPLVSLGAFEIVPPVADAVSRLSHHLAAARRVLAIADLSTPVIDPLDPVAEPTATDIVLKDAALRYGPDTPWALDGLTMSIPAPRRVALVGPSGAGKSSVVNTLLRFWALEGGEATLGGTSLERLRQETPRRIIAWVAQDTHLFNTTIRGNIALARPEATEAEITSAARAAQLGDWIDSLPDGLDTKVGEQGAQLSGGQRQRLALARALLARTPILVLDEPTSGLDEATAERLLNDVISTTAGKSILYVTHRLDELSAFDEVDVIEDGRVVSRSAP
ncbi:MAG: thiol reductant ABC exporter subunit CydC [Acidimicrobiales bacterium]